MALSPQQIRETEFKQARRGYEAAEVDTFKAEVADALEAAQNEATAMEARARAAVARLQELSKTAPERGSGAASGAAAPEATDVPADLHASVDEAETISRTLLLAQRTADMTIAEAQSEAERLLVAAKVDASGHLDAARVDAGQIVEDAEAEARRSGESERVRVEGEVQALLARRDFLEADVDHLEQYLVAQRERITEAVSELSALVSRVPNGLADMRRPLLSAAAADSPTSDDPGGDGELDGDDPDPGSELAEITRIAEADRPDGGDPGVEDATGDVWAQRDDDPEAASSPFEDDADADTTR